jgi:hypothetical protein
MGTAVQTSYSLANAAGLPGQIARHNPGDYVRTFIASATLTPGRIYFQGRAISGAAGEAGPLAAATADVDAIVATLASTAGIQTLTTTALDGVVGDDEMFPPRNVTLTLSASADWDATTAVVTGLDASGATVTENLTIPNGGAATVTGAVLFKSIVSLVVPAQSGTGGTATMGFGSLLGSIDHIVAGLCQHDATRTSLTYADGEMVPMCRVGERFVTSETAVTEGAPVWVRLVAGGGENLGDVRATPDSNDCALLKGARFTSNNAAGLSRVEFNLPAS